MASVAKKTYFRYLVLILVSALLLIVIFDGAASAQATNEPSLDSGPALNTGDLNIEENPIYGRLIEVVNFLSVGVAVVAAISVAVAGLQYMASRGDPNATAASVRRLISAATAIGLYIFGWSILNWLIPGGVLN